MVMAAARPAGATGGTVLAGKGTGARESEKFLGISLANEKDVVLIVAEKQKKADEERLQKEKEIEEMRKKIAALEKNKGASSTSANKPAAKNQGGNATKR
jgi:hypothetical protein